MKLYYPYFNLFYKDGTTNYRLDVITKIPGNSYLDAIEQKFDGKYWEVRIKLREKKDTLNVEKEKMEEFNVDLTPTDVKELDKIKIIVKNHDNLLKSDDSDGEGKTGLGNGEIE